MKKINEIINFFLTDKKSDLQNVKEDFNSLIIKLKIPNNYISDEIRELYNLTSGGFINIEKNIRWRIFNPKEFMQFNENFEFDFIQINLIPFIDCFDNDYICFDFKNNKYVFFSLSDELIFEEFKTLTKIFNTKIKFS